MWFAENLGVSNEKMCKYKRVHDNIIIYCSEKAKKAENVQIKRKNNNPYLIGSTSVIPRA